jgi:hypothetical protein
MEKKSPQQHFKAEVVHDINQLVENLTKAISHLSFTSKPRLHLFALPQEIQDIIFDLAYPSVGVFKPVIRWQWEYREKQKRKEDGNTYTTRPFPPPKVSQFLVSRRFFLAAAKAFIGNQVIINTEGPFRHELFTNGSQNVVTRFVAKATIDLGSLKFIVGAEAFAPNLKSLKLTVKDGDFDILDPKYPWEEELDDYDVKAVASYHNIDYIAGVKEFHLMHYACDYAETNEEQLIYDLNVRKLGAYMKSIVLKPRQSIEAFSSEDAAALYPASKVSLGGNKSIDSNTQGHGDCQGAAHFDMELYELPSTVEDMMALLKKDGERFMKLVANLKIRESKGCL